MKATITSSLTKVKKELERRHRANSDLLGLCSILNTLYYSESKIGFTAYRELRLRISEEANKAKILYCHDGRKTKELTQFIWHPKDFESRVAFINKLKNSYEDSF